jgi:replicative DNA helicase
MKKQAEVAPPSNVEAEQSLLAQAVLDEERGHPYGSMAKLRTRVLPEFFVTERNREIWQAECDLFDTGQPISVASIAIQIHQDRQHVTILDLEGEPLWPDPSPLVARLARAAEARRLMAACEHGMNQAALGDDPQAIREMLAERSRISTEDSALKSIEEVLSPGLDELLHSKREQGLRLPWPRLNGLLYGLHPGQLVLLAAHTSQGKTSAALQITTRAAEQNVSAVFFSLEMGPEQLVRRMISQRSGVPRRIDGGLDLAGSRARELAAANWLRAAPLWMCSSAHTVPAMLATLRGLDRKRRLGLVVVDYLQLVETTGKQEYRARDIGNLARQLKMAAQSLNVPFLVLSQFSRESAKEGRRPELYDLKESGDLENHADVVIILHTPQLDTAANERMVTAYVPKQREGPRGREVAMLFRSDVQTFEETQL